MFILIKNQIKLQRITMKFRLLFFVLLISVSYYSNAQMDTFPYQNNNYGTQINLTTVSSPTSNQLSNFHKSLKMASEPHKLEKIGKTLTFVGIPLAIIGGVMLSNSNGTQYNCYNGECEGDAQGAFGSLIFINGIGLTATGVVLWTLGRKKR